MTEEDKRNEHRKLIATWMNTVATAVFTVGTFVPLGQVVYGFVPITVDRGILYGSAIACVALAFVIHIVGHLVLGELE